MKLATFNINGIKARIEALPAWLAAAQPDVVCLQEIKSVDEGFPREIFEAMGYRVETHGQKSFNGVAILSKLPLEDVTRGLPGDHADEQARWIEATVLGRRPIRVCGLYLPNGNPVPGPKYDYKLAWMSRMEARAKVLLAQEEPTVFCGDYNVIPQDADAAKPELWTADALALPQSRFGTIKPALGSATTAFASTISCSAHRRPIFCGTARSTNRCARATSPRTMCRSGSISTLDFILVTNTPRGASDAGRGSLRREYFRPR